MNTYPSITGFTPNGRVYDKYKGQHFYIFDKLDGSNVRAEWNPKQGFYKFGRRNGLIDHSNPYLLEAPKLILDHYGEDLDARFRKVKYQRAVAYFEFYGDNSFAGFHLPEPHKVTLFDIHVYKKGLLPPAEFLKLTEGLSIANLLAKVPFTKKLAEDIWAGDLPGITSEGVVCKGKGKHLGLPAMVKVKTEAWVTKLRQTCGDDLEMYERLK